jgi:MarR family transcriptional regulator, organic hydroperoxide resistance regulator
METIQSTDTIKEIMNLYRHTNRLLNKFPAEPWIDLSLTIAQLKSLLFIAHKEKTNFKKIADALGVTPPNVTGIIDRLVEHGLVSRTESPEDRRIMLLQITTKGRNLIHKLQEDLDAQMVNILAKLSPEELSALDTGLNALFKASKTHYKE